MSKRIATRQLPSRSFSTTCMKVVRGPADLILNGDTFELLGCEGECDEGEAIARLDRILVAQPELVESLRTFSQRGEHRVVFVPGDHDAALLFRLVADRLKERVGGDVAVDGLWVSGSLKMAASSPSTAISSRASRTVSRNGPGRSMFTGSS